MLCDSIKEDELKNLKGEWLANIKFDGTRIIAVVKNHSVFLVNRRNEIVNQQFSEIAKELEKLEDCIVDGEIISYDDDFTKLQRRNATKNKGIREQLITEIPCKLMLFDVIKLGNIDLQNRTLRERVELLKNFLIFNPLSFVDMVEYLPIDKCLEKARIEKREGIIIKDMNSCYQNKRADSWKKLKFFLEKQIRVIRYSENPKGIRAETEDGIAVQIAGEQHKEVKKKIDEEGYCEIDIQYLSETENKMLRFPSFRNIYKPLKV